MSVYFVQAGDGGPIKIGYATDVAARLSKIQADNAADIKLLLVLGGDFELERELHQCFASANIRGEWFHPVRDLLDTIELNTPPAAAPPMTAYVLPDVPRHVEILRAVGVQKVAAERGLSINTVRAWEQRDSIPSWAWLWFADNGYATLEQLAVHAARSAS